MLSKRDHEYRRLQQIGMLQGFIQDLDMSRGHGGDRAL
jgi:hypothetical protein